MNGEHQVPEIEFPKLPFPIGTNGVAKAQPPVSGIPKFEGFNPFYNNNINTGNSNCTNAAPNSSFAADLVQKVDTEI
jgi:hypothetical protein